MSSVKSEVVLKKKDDKKRRSKSWVLILYPDNEKHCKIYADIVNHFDSVATILHDKDEIEGIFDNESENKGFKKAHWHILITFINARYYLSLCSELELDEEDYHLLCECHSVKGYLKYMIHFGYDDKYQYSRDSMFCNEDLYMKLTKAMKIDKVEEEIRVKQIKGWIFKHDDIVLPDKLFDFCVENGYYSDYRRAYSIFNELLKVHNDIILKQSKKGEFLYD